jgi:AcrR family transcriptional regulator
VAALGLFICLAASAPVETDPVSGTSTSALDDQWLHMRTLLRHRRRVGARVDRGRIAVAPPPRRVISREQVVAGASRLFVCTGTVDMQRLAVALSVSRATLYRIVHSRDELLAEVLWYLADGVLTRARQERTRDGVDGVLEVGRGFSRRVVASRAFRQFLADEPETASRVLFTAAAGVQAKAVEAAKCVFIEAAPPDGPQPWLAGDLDQLASLYLRIFESMYYGELLHGCVADPDLVEHAARALLQRAAAAPVPA